MADLQVMLQTAAMLMCEMMEEDSEEEEAAVLATLVASLGKKSVPKISDYAEFTVPQFDDSTFKSHFRMSPSTFEILHQYISSYVDNGDGRVHVDSKKQLLMAIWILANQESFRSVAERFGVSKSTAHDCLMKIVDALLMVNQDRNVISWPSHDKAKKTADEFEASHGFPGVIGCVDGSHIPIKAPQHNPSSYVNRKGFHSILLQGVCDEKLQFIDCYAGEVGSIHDACMLRRSELFEKLQQNSLFFPPGTHLLGDPAYPIMQHLLIPFKDNGRLTRRELKFNNTLSSVRCAIERAFALLKGRFRRLKHLNMTRVDLSPKVIIACCVLHNICISLNDQIDNDTDDIEDVSVTNPTSASYQVTAANRADGLAKRNDIADNLV